jgi:predicted acetyltransferase
MREEAQPVSALYTPHPDLYRRYGWIYAAANVRYSWNPKQMAPWDKRPPAGRVERITEEELDDLVSVYEQHTAGRTGYLQRSETWWKEAVFRRLYDPERKPNDVAIWRDERDGPAGYVVYRVASRERVVDEDVATLALWEFVALTGDASIGLLRYLLSHDLTGEIAWWGPVDSPLALAFENSHFLNRRLDDSFMLRIVDVEKAIAARPPAAGAPEGFFTIAVADPAAPWNQGTWLIECSGGRLSARRTEDAAHIETDAASLAAIYSGHLRVKDAAAAGLALVSDPRAAELADRVLASDYPPFGSDFF